MQDTSSEPARESHGPVNELPIDPAVREAIVGRRSIRDFLDRPVPLETVRDLLAVSSRAPSMTNTQPWRVWVLTGAVLQRLTDALGVAHAAGQQWDAEYGYYPAQWRAPFIDRRRQVGWDLYGLLGIEKGDREATARQHGRNYAFFGAPVGMVLTLSRELQTGSYLDMGMFMQNLMVAARGAGLDTCPQAAFAFMHPIIRRELSIPDDEVIVCGLALGHADERSIVNRLRTHRADVNEFANFLS